MFLCLKSVTPSKMGIQRPLISKKLDSRLRTSGMTILDFCKNLIIKYNLSLISEKWRAWQRSKLYATYYSISFRAEILYLFILFMLSNPPDELG